MSGSSRGGFTWKQVADILRVSRTSDCTISGSEIERRRATNVEANHGRGSHENEQRKSQRIVNSRSQRILQKRA